jgi:hypothetical protein
MVKDELLLACQENNTKGVNKLLKLGIIPNIECVRECCNHIDNLKGVFYQMIKIVKPDYECLKNLCININNSNMENTVQCIKKMLKFKIVLDYECIKYLIESEIDNNDFVNIIIEIFKLLKRKLDINSTKHIMKKRNVIGRLSNYIGKVDEECYNLLIMNSMSLKSDIIKAFMANGLKISSEMLKNACKYKYNNDVIKNILHYCKNIKIDRECLELLCNNPGNCDIVIEYINELDIDIEKIFKYICINGNILTIKKCLKQNINVDYECFYELCNRDMESLLIHVLMTYDIKVDLKCLNRIIRWCKNKEGLINIILKRGVKPNYESFRGSDMIIKELLLENMSKYDNLLKKAYEDNNLLIGLNNFKLFLNNNICPSDHLVRNICKTQRNINFVNILIEYKEKLNINFDTNCLKYLCNHPFNSYNIKPNKKN